MAKAVVSFDVDDLTPVQKFELLAKVADLLDTSGVAHYEITENPAEWQDFSDIKVAANAAVDTLVAVGQQALTDLFRNRGKPES